MTIRFATKRGRPRKNHKTEHTDHDGGTQELIMKRALGLTKEPVDILLEYGLISKSEHRTCLHFRWLYSLRYGIERITSSTFDGQSTMARAEGDDTLWRRERESEFTDKADALQQAKLYAPLCDILIHQQWPMALRKMQLSKLSNKRPNGCYSDPTIQSFKNAVILLCKH